MEGRNDGETLRTLEREKEINQARDNNGKRMEKP